MLLNDINPIFFNKVKDIFNKFQYFTDYRNDIPKVWT